MTRATRAKKAEPRFAAETIAEARERMEELAAEARKALVRRALPVEKRLERAAARSRKVVVKRVRPLEKSVETLRRTAAGWLHEAARLLDRAERLVAPPRASKRSAPRRAKSPRVTLAVGRPREAGTRVVAKEVAA